MTRILFIYRRMVSVHQSADVLFGGGAQKRIFQLACHLASLPGHEIFFASADAGDSRIVRTLVDHGVKHIRLDLDSTSRLLPAIVKLRRFVRRQHIDIVNANDRKSALVAYFGTLFLPVKYVFTCRAVFRGLRLSQYWLGRHIVGVSNGVKKHLIDYFHCRPGDITVIFNGTDIQPCRPREVEELRQRLNLPPGAKTLVCTGRLDPRKGHRVVLDALKEVLKTHPEVYFLVVGDGVDKDDLHCYADQHGLGRQLILCGYQDHLAPYYELADITVLPSYSEGLPGTLLEAALLGRPIVATNIPGCNEIVEDGVSGFLVPPGDSCLFAKRIMELFDDPSLQQKFSKNARDYAEKNFSLAAMFEHYEKFFASL